MIRHVPAQWARTTCFILVAVMNLSAWIDVQGLIVEIPLIVTQAPEGWALPSATSICLSVANIAPIIIVLLHWPQGNRFSEIPYIYLIIVVDLLLCCVLAFTWQRTIFLFGRERSVWFFGSFITLAMLDCSSSLVFFDYMKRFRDHYLTAVFLGEALTGIIPMFLLLAQGVGGEATCVLTINGTSLEPIYSEPRFSVKIYILLLGCIMVVSLISFILLRWTNIVALADAVQPVIHQTEELATDTDPNENRLMVFVIEPPESKSRPQMTRRVFIFLLLINTINSTILFGGLPSLSTYALLPYGQKAFYYSSLLTPAAYSVALLINLRWETIAIRATVIGSVIGLMLSIFIVIIATQSPCPWWSDTTHGAIIIVISWFLVTLIIAFSANHYWSSN
ncbi:unnamed protein product [Rotaria magnacalcarata]|uniref:Riboflavin transporter n=4 Tax=Rotaria magnacalcarata TaxID=392030 RepID=A0A8S2R903_9BILA|nr:unnamed protein product [Rotaria magnacalcarata]